MAKNYTTDVKKLQDLLINKILIVSALAGVVAYISTLFRTSAIGFTYRDAIQLSATIGIVSIAILHKKIEAHTKGIILILSFTLGGIAGLFTLGIMAGMIFIFPAAAIIIAVFYSLKALWIYILSYFLFFCLIAFLFCSGKTALSYSADILLTSYFHWAVYFLSMVIFFTVSSVTVYSYRKSMELMVQEITHQKNELQVALKEVKTLSGLLPICSNCKKIRDDKGYWNQIESYINAHSEVKFTHSICPECLKNLYPNVVLDNEDQ